MQSDIKSKTAKPEHQTEFTKHTRFFFCKECLNMGFVYFFKESECEFCPSCGNKI